MHAAFAKIGHQRILTQRLLTGYSAGGRCSKVAVTGEFPVQQFIEIHCTMGQAIKVEILRPEARQDVHGASSARHCQAKRFRPPSVDNGPKEWSARPCGVRP